MADDGKESDPQQIDSIINDLTERKNDERRSLHKKRPSPNAHDKSHPTKCHGSGQQSTHSQNENCSKQRSRRARHTGHVIDHPKSVLLDSDESALDDSSSIAVSDLISSSGEDLSDSLHHEGVPLPKIRKKSPRPSNASTDAIQVTSSITNKEFVERFKRLWSEADASGPTMKQPIIDDGTVTLLSDPFKICVVQNFIGDKAFMDGLVDEMCQMEWQRKQMDLYEFHQTTDFANLATDTKPALRLFYETLNNVMLPWMREVSGLDLTYVSASCSMYNYGDFLLVHDDLLTDRQVAFVYYISPWPDSERWTDEMGGALELFECDPATGQPKYPIVKKIPPQNDQFTFFRVCEKSFHQVGEVTNMVYPRLTINGWFHGRPAEPVSALHDAPAMHVPSNISNSSVSALETVNNTVPQMFLMYHSPLSEEMDLTEWINSSYLEGDTKNCIQQHIEEKSEASLELFLIPEFYDLLVSEFRENRELDWQLEGPANQRKYETLRLTSHATGPPKDLHTLFCSKAMFSLLQQYTELDFDGPSAVRPQCSVQICRFTQGCYTLLGESSTFTENALDIMLFFNSKNNVGTVTYLSPNFTNCDAEEHTDATTDSTVIASAKASASTRQAIPTPAGAKSVASGSSVARKPLSSSKSSSSASTAARAASGDETGADESSISCDPLEDVEIVSILHKRRNNLAVRKRKRTEVSSNDEEDDDKEARENEEEEDDSDDESEANHYGDDGNEDYEIADFLQREEVLLTIHPKNNALNLVYRTAGQTKFVKYVSKNCIKPDEYVYILFATYKE